MYYVLHCNILGFSETVGHYSIMCDSIMNDYMDDYITVTYRKVSLYIGSKIC